MGKGARVPRRKGTIKKLSHTETQRTQSFKYSIPDRIYPVPSTGATGRTGLDGSCRDEGCFKEICGGSSQLKASELAFSHDESSS